MPIYQYQCQDCGHVDDEIRKVDARESPTKCSACRGKSHLIVSGGSMIDLKGDGFYKRGKDLGSKKK